MINLEEITVQSRAKVYLAKLMSGKGRKTSKSGARAATMSRKMSKKAKAKSRPAVKLKRKLRSRKAAKRGSIKTKKMPAAKIRSAARKIVRIMGRGQFAVDIRTLKKLSDIDTAIVELVSAERSDDYEFKKKLTEMSDMVVKHGKPVDPREIIKSDIILPSADLSIDEAKRLFRGEGVVPEV